MPDWNGQFSGREVDELLSKMRRSEVFTPEQALKLEDIEPGAQVNVQANWTEENIESDAYIQNKPQIFLLLAKTTAEWNADPLYIANANTIYVYTDYDQEGGVDIPALKIGVNNMYLKNIPFTAGTSIVITPADIERWNDKVTAFVDPDNHELLVFSKE